MKRLVGLTLLPLGVALPACEPSSDWASSSSPIIDGRASPELTGVVHVRHPLSAGLCSGVVVSAVHVVTAKHCAFRELDGVDDEPLAPDGFRVGFGPDVEHLVVRDVERLTWIGAPDELEVQPAVDAGEDVAVLQLTSAVPPGTHIHAIAPDHVPALDHTYQLSGYGLASVDTWDSGTKRVTTDHFTGFDAEGGVIQTTGHGACNGDSGGPLLFDDDLVGVISDIGGTDAGDFCTLGATFSTTVLNPRVRALLEAELAALPPCEERDEVCDNQQDENCDGHADEGCSGGAGGADGGDAGASGANLAGANGSPGGRGVVVGGTAGGGAEGGGMPGGAVALVGGASGVSRGGAGVGSSTSGSGCGCRAESAPRHRMWSVVGAALILLGRARRRRRRFARADRRFPHRRPQRNLTAMLRGAVLGGLTLVGLLGCGSTDSTSESPATGGASMGGTSGSSGAATGGGLTAGAAGAPPLGVEPRRPFGEFAPQYDDGAVLPSGDREELQGASADFYDEWKSRYVASGCGSGRFIVATGFDDENLTLSEGIGYGMIASAYFAGHDPDAKSVFDGLYRLFRDHPAASSNDLMTWYLNEDCEPERGGERDDVSASDGDLDIAYALLLADSQWGSCGDIDYHSEAEKVLTAIAAHELSGAQDFVLLGDWPREAPWTDLMRSSDFMPGHFAAFADTGETALWTGLIDGLFTRLSALRDNAAEDTGLFPDFILDPAGTPEPASGGTFTAEDAAYYWNACRLPLRVGTHFVTTGDARARELLQPLNTWAQAATAGEPLEFASGYSLDGAPLEGAEFPSMAFIAPLGVSAMVSANNQSWLDSLWSTIIAAPPEGYFEDSVRLLSLIALSESWWLPEASESCD